MAAKKKAPSKPIRTPSNKGAATAAPEAKIRAHSGAKAGVPDLTPAQRLAKARATANKINESFKSQVVIPANEAHSNYFLRRPSGIMQLDIDCAGGLPASSFNTISGPDNAGKSTLLYHYFAMHQRLYGNEAYCALVCSEATIDYVQARRCGWIIPFPLNVINDMMKAREKEGKPPLTDDEIADMRREIGVNHVVLGLSTAEEMLDVTLRLLETNLYGIIGLDSFEGLMPSAEAQLNTLEDFPQQAARASAITRFLQHYGPVSRKPDHFTTFIMTCQVRTNRKKSEAQSHIQKYLKDWASTVPGAVKHWRQIEVSVWSGAKINHKNRDEKIVLGKEVNWELAKGKNGAHDNTHGSTSYFYDARGFDTLHTVLTAGLRYGVVIEKDGELTFMKNGDQHEYLRNIDGPSKFMIALLEAPDVEMELRHAILAAANKSCIYV